VPLASGAHDGSELTVFVPIETNEPQLAIAGCVCTSSESRVSKIARRTFMFEPSLVKQLKGFEEKFVALILVAVAVEKL
jgi:hypothetical protein